MLFVGDCYYVSNTLFCKNVHLKTLGYRATPCITAVNKGDEIPKNLGPNLLWFRYIAHIPCFYTNLRFLLFKSRKQTKVFKKQY